MAETQKAGWNSVSDTRKTYTLPNADPIFDRAPRLDGWEPFFVARHGREYTTWTYRPVKEQTNG